LGTSDEDGEDIEGDEPEKDIDPFNERYGWIYSATQLRDHEGIPLEQVYDLNLIRALNGLAYIKAHEAHQEKQMKKAKEDAQNTINGQ
jgi:hypothetical protein